MKIRFETLKTHDAIVLLPTLTISFRWSEFSLVWVVFVITINWTKKEA